MIITLPSTSPRDYIDTAKPLIFSSNTCRLRLTPQNIAVLHATQDIEIWSAPWNRIIRIKANGGKNKWITIESKERIFFVKEADTFDEGREFVEYIGNAYLKTFQGKDNAQKDEIEKYGRFDSILKSLYWGLAGAYTSLFIFLIFGISDQFSSNPATATLDQISRAVAASLFVFYLFLAFVLAPIRYFREPRYNKSGIILAGFIFGFLAGFISFFCAVEGQNAVAGTFTRLRGVPFETSYTVKSKDIFHDRVGFRSNFELETGDKQTLSVRGFQSDFDSIKFGVALKVTGLRSQYGIQVDHWTYDKDPRRNMADIIKLITKNDAEIVSAHNRALRLFPDLRDGTVRFKVSISQDGSVSDCHLLFSELSEPDLEDTIVSTIKKLNYGAVSFEDSWEGQGDIKFTSNAQNVGVSISGS